MSSTFSPASSFRFLSWFVPIMLLPVSASHATATTVIYTLSLHDALPIFALVVVPLLSACGGGNSTAPSPTSSFQSRSEEHTSELQSRQYLVCRLLLEKKNRSGLTPSQPRRRIRRASPRQRAL